MLANFVPNIIFFNINWVLRFLSSAAKVVLLPILEKPFDKY